MGGDVVFLSVYVCVSLALLLNVDGANTRAHTHQPGEVKRIGGVHVLCMAGVCVFNTQKHIRYLRGAFYVC